MCFSSTKINEQDFLKYIASYTKEHYDNIEFTGFQISEYIRKQQNKRIGMPFGTLYNYLYKLERKGILSSRWEDIDHAQNTKIPRKRFYLLILLG